MDETKKKNELGNIYGSRVSKNGKWLNLLIVTHVDGKETRITCPVRLESAADNPDEPRIKPIASTYTENGRRARILNIPVYEDKKPTDEQATREDCDLPF